MYSYTHVFMYSYIHILLTEITQQPWRICASAALALLLAQAVWRRLLASVRFLHDLTRLISEIPKHAACVRSRPDSWPAPGCL